MTRKSKHDLKRDLEDLEAEADGVGSEVFLFAYRDPRTGELTTSDGEPIVPNDRDGLLAVEHTVVMERERAEEHGIEILGPAEDVPNDRDVVRVPSDAYREVDPEDRPWHAE